MPNPCGAVHMPNFPCRECDRARSLKPAPEKVDAATSDAVRISANPKKAKRGPVVSRPGLDESHQSDEGPDSPPDAGVDRSGALSIRESQKDVGKSDRLAVGREAIEEGIRKEADSAALRARRYREKKKLEDPEFMERERMRKRRQS